MAAVDVGVAAAAQAIGPGKGLGIGLLILVLALLNWRFFDWLGRTGDQTRAGRLLTTYGKIGGTIFLIVFGMLATIGSIVKLL